MITSISNDIQITVHTAYQEKFSNPLENNFIHAYQVTIVNQNDYPVQLKSRKWMIKEMSGKHTVVNGEGVIGQTPILHPGERFEYVSSCPLESAIGKMEGYYKFQRLDTGEQFISSIPSFQLIYPLILN